MLNFTHFKRTFINARMHLILILLSLGSIINLITAIETASFRDLDFQTPYFQLQADTWTVTDLASSGSSTISTACGTSPLLGGPGVFSSSINGGAFEKVFNVTIPHTATFITFDITFIDTWGDGEQILIYMNDTSIGEIYMSTTDYNQFATSNLCGSSSVNDLASVKVFVQVPSSNYMDFSLRRDTGTLGQFAIRNFNFALSNKTGLSNDYCIHLPSGSSNTERCPCDLYEFYESYETNSYQCTSCHSSCETCSGTAATSCYTCVEGFTFNGTHCVLCDPTCDTCFGTAANQCARCPGGSYLYPDFTCQTTCDSAFITVEDGYSYCDPYKCNALNTYDYEQVKNQTLYFYTNQSICKTICPSPYNISVLDRGFKLCELLLSEQDINYVNHLISVGATTGSVMTAGVTVITALSPSNPTAVSVATLAQMFEYTRQFDVTRPPRLELYYETHSAAAGIILIGDGLSAAEIAKFTYRTLPEIFVKNGMHSSFMVNFFQSFESLLIYAGATLLLIGIQVFIKRKYAHLLELFEKVVLAVIAYLTTQFYSIIAAILFLGTIQFMSFKGGNGLDWLSFFFAIIFYFLILSLLAYHFIVIWTYQKIKAQAGTEEGDNKMKEFQVKHKKVEVLYKDFKDVSFIEQAFLLFLTARAAVTGIIMAALWAYPGVQIVYNILMNILTIVYLAFKSPYKSLPIVFQQIIYELDLILVNICFIVIAALDVSGGQSDNLKALLGDVIINAIFTSKFIPIITILPKAIDAIKEGIKVIQERRKAKNSYQLPTESPLTSPGKRETENEPIIKENIVIELTEKEGQNPLKKDALEPVKLEGTKIKTNSKTYLEGEYDEFESEVPSPINQIYARQTFLNKDEETPKTSSGHQPSETAIRPIRLDDILRSRTCVGGEEGDEFQDQGMSPIMQLNVRESLMK